MRNHSILALVIIALLAGTAAEAKYSDGTGEPNDPYRIATPEDLNDIGNHEEDWDKHFILINDINLAEYTGTQFKIIGRWSLWYDPNNKSFSGVFDGNDHKVLNFTWMSSDRNGIGIFGCVGKDGQIKNLGMENININTINGGCVGGLVGHSMGTITNCYSTGSVNGTESGVGGLIGENYGTITNCYSTGNVNGAEWGIGGLIGENYGTITNCYSTGNVLGYGAVGGLVGWNCDGAITNCYSTGNVSGADDHVGGLVGHNSWFMGTITNCYSTSNVSGTRDDVGGLVGHNLGTITNCYSTGSVITTGDDVGGLVGNNHGGVVNSFWDIETSGQLGSDGGEPKTTAEMKTIDTFIDAGWNFVEVWAIGEHQTYSYLKFAPAGDLNYDKKVNLVDLAIFASHWLEGN